MKNYYLVNCGNIKKGYSGLQGALRNVWHNPK